MNDEPRAKNWLETAVDNVRDMTAAILRPSTDNDRMTTREVYILTLENSNPDDKIIDRIVWEREDDRTAKAMKAFPPVVEALFGLFPSDEAAYHAENSTFADIYPALDKLPAIDSPPFYEAHTPEPRPYEKDAATVRLDAQEKAAIWFGDYRDRMAVEPPALLTLELLDDDPTSVIHHPLPDDATPELLEAATYAAIVIQPWVADGDAEDAYRIISEIEDRGGSVAPSTDDGPYSDYQKWEAEQAARFPAIAAWETTKIADFEAMQQPTPHTPEAKFYTQLAPDNETRSPPLPAEQAVALFATYAGYTIAEQNTPQPDLSEMGADKVGLYAEDGDFINSGKDYTDLAERLADLGCIDRYEGGTSTSRSYDVFDHNDQPWASGVPAETALSIAGLAQRFVDNDFFLTVERQNEEVSLILNHDPSNDIAEARADTGPHPDIVYLHPKTLATGATLDDLLPAAAESARIRIEEVRDRAADPTVPPSGPEPEPTPPTAKERLAARMDGYRAEREVNGNDEPSQGVERSSNVVPFERD